MSTTATDTPTARAFAQGKRDAAENVPTIDRSTWEFYTGPMADDVWNAYCAGREAAK